MTETDASPRPAGEEKLQKLDTLFSLYESWVGEFSFACSKGCATCCTQSVSMTMLEGELIHQYIVSERPELLSLAHSLPAGRMNQKTTNQFAAACLRQEDEWEDEQNWDMTPCAFLRDDCCLIYPVRPFMCRSFGSKVECGMTGTAEVDELFLTLNTVVLQCIEHLDHSRPWGNMNTIMHMIFSQDDWQKQGGQTQTGNYRLAQPIPGFLIPPAEKPLLENKLSALLQILEIPS